MSRDGERLLPTPGQTVGPFFAIGLPWEVGPRLVAPNHPRAIRLHGYLRDGHGDPVPDGMIEIWQADERGEIPRIPGSIHREGAAFTGFGRASTDPDGHYEFHTLLPGIAHAAPNTAPFIAVAVFSRGLNDRLFTRIYLPQYAALNAADPFLNALDERERATLVATREADGALRHDIHLQGERETVFLAFRA
jgi:protocatechuate 3,4-dioxygenase alpha subunit